MTHGAKLCNKTKIKTREFRYETRCWVSYYLSNHLIKIILLLNTNGTITKTLRFTNGACWFRLKWLLLLIPLVLFVLPSKYQHHLYLSLIILQKVRNEDQTKNSNVSGLLKRLSKWIRNPTTVLKLANRLPEVDLEKLIPETKKTNNMIRGFMKSLDD